MLHVALLEPEIAGNTGQIARTCLAAGCALDLIRPLGFHLDDASLRRAGMDYWDRVDVRVHAGWAAFRAALAPAFAGGRVYAFSARAGARPSVLAGASSAPGDAVLLFGSESRGLPEPALAGTVRVRLPMRPGTRSLNLSAAVAAAVYLVWSAAGFAGAD